MKTRYTEFSLIELVDDIAGDWPSRSFLKLFSIAQKCLIEKMLDRPEMHNVRPSFFPGKLLKFLLLFWKVYILLDELAVMSGKLFAEESSKKPTTGKKT